MLLLEGNADLRRRMGEEGNRTAQNYDWSNSIRALEEEWNQSLEMARCSRAKLPSKRGTLVYGLDLIQAHDHYPTAYLSDQDRVGHVNILFGETGPDFISWVMNPTAMLQDEGKICQDIYLTLLGAPERSIGEFVQEFACNFGIDPGLTKYCLFRLVKYGFLNVTKAACQPCNKAQAAN